MEKLTDAALATDDADAHHLAGAAQRMLEQLVDHLVLAKQKSPQADRLGGDKRSPGYPCQGTSINCDRCGSVRVETP
jgi:hypothetical protein